ncbi:hypothetical protein Tco_1515964 [Tanacetum coccineum]
MLHVQMSADVPRGHGGDGGGDERRPSISGTTAVGGIARQPSKGTRNPNLGAGRAAGRITLQEPKPRVKGHHGLRVPPLPLAHTLLVANCRRKRKAVVVGKDWETELTCVPTWNPDQLATKSMRHPASTCKRSNNAKKAALQERYWFPKRTEHMTWSASDADVPRTFLRWNLSTRAGAHPGIGRVLPGQCTVMNSPPSQSTTPPISLGQKRENSSHEQVNMFRGFYLGVTTSFISDA